MKTRCQKRSQADLYWPMCGGVMVAIEGSVPFVSPRAPIHHRGSNGQYPYTSTTVFSHIHVYYINEYIDSRMETILVLRMATQTRPHPLCHTDLHHHSGTMLYPPIPSTTSSSSSTRTKPKAINLFARQPATRHCVYPHVNHYVRPRDIDALRIFIPNLTYSQFPH